MLVGTVTVLLLRPQLRQYSAHEGATCGCRSPPYRDELLRPSLDHAAQAGSPLAPHPATTARSKGLEAAAAPPSSVMNSRRFTARCLPCFKQNSAPPLRQETAALRDSDPAYVGSGSIASIWRRPRVRLSPHSGHRGAPVIRREVPGRRCNRLLHAIASAAFLSDRCPTATPD